MKKYIAQALLAVPVWFMLGSIGFAMCVWFAPPSRQFEPDTNMKTLISRHNNDITMTVQPQFSGNATDFALVMPFPSEPVVEEAPADIFTQLEDLTNPEVAFDDFIGLDAATQENARSSDGVRVIEERDVGDFSTVSLSATSESALITWLNNEGYEVTPEKQAIVANYVASGGYFVALKVNMDKADVDEDGFLQGELAPISFKFTNESVMIPLRLLAGESSVVTLTIYTLADKLSYIPGAEIQYSKKVDATHLKEAPALENYDAWKQWLVRNVVQVETGEIKADVEVLATIENRIVVPGEQPLVLNPDQLPKDTGVIVSENGMTIYTDETEEVEQTTVAQATSRITSGMVIVLAISNVVLLTILVANKNTPISAKK